MVRKQHVSNNHGQLLPSPSWPVCWPDSLAHPGPCPGSSSFPLVGSLGSILPLIMESFAMEAARTVLGMTILMALFSCHSAYRQMRTLSKEMVSQRNLHSPS